MGFEAGAVEYICKPFSVAELKLKIESLLGYVNRQTNRNKQEIKNKLLNVLLEDNKRDYDFTLFRKKCELYAFTEREQQIITELMRGLENKEIGQELSLSTSTIKNYVSGIYKKCEVQNRVELVNLMKKE